MIRYHVLRHTAIALRALFVALFNAANKADLHADAFAHTAKEEGLAALDRQEDKAFEAVSKARAYTNRVMDALLDKEDEAIDNFEDVCETADEMRRHILTEVL